MLDPRTLRGRLSLAYAAGLVAALVIFAGLALWVVDRLQWRALDSQLQATAQSVRAIIEVGGGRVQVESADRRQFASIVGEKVASAVFRADGSVAVSTNVSIPPAIRTFVLRLRAPSYETIVLGGDRVRVYAVPLDVRGRTLGAVADWRDADSIDELDRSVTLAFAIAIPLLAALATFAGATIARRGLAPLERIVSVASEIEAHDLSRRLAFPARPEELGRLGSTFDRMLDRLQRAFQRERTFTSDASHELRAPLSVIRAEADLALRKERTPEEYRAALETIAAEADALEALTRELLAAARSDAENPEARVAVNLANVVDDVARRFAVVARERNIEIDRRLALDAVIEAHPGPIERAVVTVVHNALKYAPEGGHVGVDVRRDAECAEVCVTDDGPGFSEEALYRAFDRFWRDDASRAEPGSGLGLAIAQTIAERYGGSIAVTNRETGGAAVRLRFALHPPDGARSS